MYSLNKGASLLIGIIISIYTWSVWRYTFNFPYWDDYPAILKFLVFWDLHPNYWDRFFILFSQHNEHRNVLTHLIEWLQWEVTGEINFTFLALIGNLGWMMLLYTLWRMTGRMRAITFLPVVLLFGTMSHYQLMSWAMASIQQYYQLWFSMMALWMMTQQRYGISFIWAILSIFTGLAGLLLVPILLLHPLIHRQWRWWLRLSIGLMAVLWFFFIALGYSPNTEHVTPTAMGIFLFALAFLGSVIPSFTWAALLGGSALLIFGYRAHLTYQRYPILFWGVILVVLTALSGGVSRSGFHLDLALNSRYSIYSLLLLSLIYLQYSLLYAQKIWHIVALLMTGTLFGLWLEHGLLALQTRYSSWSQDPIFYSRPDELSLAENDLKSAYTRGIFTQWRSLTLLPSERLLLPSRPHPHLYTLTLLGSTTQGDPLHLTLPRDGSILLRGSTRITPTQRACGAYLMIDQSMLIPFALTPNSKGVLDQINFRLHLDPSHAHTLQLYTIDTLCRVAYPSTRITLTP